MVEREALGNARHFVREKKLSCRITAVVGAGKMLGLWLLWLGGHPGGRNFMREVRLFPRSFIDQMNYGQFA